MNQIFIKRVELHHTEDYIKSILGKYGDISNIEFIPKSNERGQKYNGALITIEYNYSNACKKFLENLEKLDLTKIFHNNKYFWLLSKSQKKPLIIEEPKENNSSSEYFWEKDETLSEVAIKYLQEMQCKINKLNYICENLEKRVNKAEQTAMRAEHDRTQEWLYAKDKDSEVFFRDAEIGWLKEEIEELKQNKKN